MSITSSPITKCVLVAALALALPVGFIDAHATGKAAVLPGQLELDASMDALQKVIDLSHIKQPTLKDKKRLRDTAAEGLQHAENFLATVKLKRQAPGFNEAFRGQYMTGLRKIRDGLDLNDAAQVSAGTKMLNQFIDWMQRQPRV